jgi:hypothetical protein
VPLFPELLPYLREVFEQAEPGAVYVITRYRRRNANLRTQLVRIIRRAGLKPWSRLFQNLRSTRETELAERFPAHAVCRWLGNSQVVAAKHYLQVTDEHFQRAVRQPTGTVPEVVHDPVQNKAVGTRNGLQSERPGRGQPLLFQPLRGLANPSNALRPISMGVTGLERGTMGSDDGNDVREGQVQSDAESGAVGAQDAPTDPHLQRLTEAWARLPEAVKAERSEAKPTKATHLSLVRTDDAVTATISAWPKEAPADVRRRIRSPVRCSGGPGRRICPCEPLWLW